MTELNRQARRLSYGVLEKLPVPFFVLTGRAQLHLYPG